MDLPIDNGNWTQNLRAYGEHRKEMWDADNKPCGIWRWYYDSEKTRKKAELEFDDDYPLYMTCWYENGALKGEGRYKDGFPRWDAWNIWSENGELELGEKEKSWWNPIDAGYVAFAIAFTATTIFNWLYPY